MDIDSPGKLETHDPSTAHPGGETQMAHEDYSPVLKTESENGSFHDLPRRVTISSIRERLESPAPFKRLPLSSAEREELHFLRAQVSKLITEKEDVQLACEEALRARNEEMKTLLVAFDRVERELAETKLRVRSSKVLLLQAAYALGFNGEADGGQDGLVDENLAVRGFEHDLGSPQPLTEVFHRHRDTKNEEGPKETSDDSLFNGASPRSTDSRESTDSQELSIAAYFKRKNITHIELSPRNSPRDSPDTTNPDDSDYEVGSLRPNTTIHSDLATPHRRSARTVKSKAATMESKGLAESDSGNFQRSRTAEFEETTDDDSQPASDYEEVLPSIEIPKVQPLRPDQLSYDTPSGTRSRTLLPGWVLPEEASFDEEDLVENNGVAWICRARSKLHGPAPGRTVLTNGARRSCPLCRAVRRRAGNDMDFSLPPGSNIEVTYLPGQWEYNATKADSAQARKRQARDQEGRFDLKRKKGESV